MDECVRKLLRLFISTIVLLMSLPVTVAEEHTRLLDGVDGKKHALSEYVGHGKWVVVNLWATACPYCRHELFDLINFHEAHSKQDAMVLGFTVDWPSFEIPSKAHVASFASDHFVEYPLLLTSGDVAGQVIGKPVNMVPISFLYNPEGLLVRRINGIVTEKMLNDAIKQKQSTYRIDWAEEVPPEYQPKLEQ